MKNTQLVFHYSWPLNELGLYCGGPLRNIFLNKKLESFLEICDSLKNHRDERSSLEILKKLRKRFGTNAWSMCGC